MFSNISLSIFSFLKTIHELENVIQIVDLFHTASLFLFIKIYLNVMWTNVFLLLIQISHALSNLKLTTNWFFEIFQIIYYQHQISHPKRIISKQWKHGNIKIILIFNYNSRKKVSKTGKTCRRNDRNAVDTFLFGN